MKVQRTRIASYGLIRDTDRILLCRISRELPRWQGQWTLPGGGIDFGEHPQSAMVREVMEETGLSVQPTRLVTINSICDDSGDVDFHGIQIVYMARYQGGELRHERAGTTDFCRWFTKPELADLELVEIAEMGAGFVFGE